MMSTWNGTEMNGMYENKVDEKKKEMLFRTKRMFGTPTETAKHTLITF